MSIAIPDVDTKLFEQAIANREHDEDLLAKKVRVLNGLNLTSWDYLSNAPTATTDVFTFKNGGASGTTIATLTITYTDSTKAVIQTLIKT